MLDWAGESRYYVESKCPAAFGYLEATTEPGRTRDRTVYPLTDRGMEALRAWARTPVALSPVKSEPMLRLLIADLVGEAPTREAIGTLRADIAELSARLDESAASAEALPHRREYLLLSLDLLRRLLAAHLEWIDEVERALDPEDT